MVLLDGLPGEEQKQQQHGETEDCGAPTAHQGTQATEAMSHQDAVTHAGRGGMEVKKGGGERGDKTDMFDIWTFAKIITWCHCSVVYVFH